MATGHRYTLVAWVLLGAALGEFLVLRLLMRMGALLPDDLSVRPLYTALVLVGAIFLNLAYLLAVAVVGRRAWGRMAQRRWGDVLGGLLLASGGGVALAVAMGRILGLYSLWLFSAQVVLLPLALAYCAWSASGNIALRAWMWGVVGVEVLGAYSALVSPLGLLGRPLPGASLAVQGAEGMVLLLAVGAAFWLRPRWNPVALAVAGGVCTLFLGMGLSRPWTASTIAIWTMGTPLSTGVPVYALAMGVFVYCLADAFGRDGRSLGLALLALSGVRVDIPYMAALALAGAALMAWPSLQPAPVVIEAQKTLVTGAQGARTSSSR
ncbi:MAG: hypothetical protein ACK4K2_00475 [Dehalococcoidia bacterium]